MSAVPPDAPAGRTHAPVLGARALFVVGTGIGALLFLRSWLDELAASGRANAGIKLLEEFSGAYLAVLLVPLIVRAARRFPLRGRGALFNLPVHLLGALAFAATHTTLMWLSRSLLAPLFGLGVYQYGHLPTRYLMELPMQLAIYAGTVLLTLAFDRYRRLRDAEVEAATLRAQLTQAQIEALSRQIEPHFLFNTLNAISELMYSSPRVADEMMSRLSELLRHAFQQRNAPEATLAEELRLLELYLAIMRLRFGERLGVRIDVPDALRGAQVPRLLLQPLVENALQHGVDPATQTVDVEISVAAEADDLLIRVRDHGPGPGRSERGGVGLDNTAARIARLYGAVYGLRLRNAEGGGAEAEVRLPLARTPEAD
ncbi:sensor histidine kinase [Rehaibacterium terrae]|uniref:Histidine kinase/HSP90-like ATPase domain-containing protein n=1 Tax=Rehaibacterium terrae TaxID=1341696 RepID=A0A7W7Y0X1_9GAMM|nr:histidine kinase [Rehaibacterium terrae]MBB5016058.1 hypothetical protein [Rehaibacterium terrae]